MEDTRFDTKRSNHKSKVFSALAVEGLLNLAGNFPQLGEKSLLFHSFYCEKPEKIKKVCDIRQLHCKPREKTTALLIIYKPKPRDELPRVYHVKFGGT